MKKIQIRLLVGFVCLGLIAVLNAFQTAHAKDRVIKLKFANFFPPPVAQSKICEKFIKDLEMHTGGRIK